MFDASTLEVFIASTNDLAPARTAVEEVLRDWNSRNGKDRQIILKPIRWEADVTPELGPGSFQAVINNRLLDHADILVGIVGKRLGSPTGSSIAGTVEEIERFAEAKKPVLLYFSDEPFNLSEIDAEELKAVREFRESMQQRGLYRTFKSIEHFKAQLRDHMDSLLQSFQALLIPAGRALAYGYFENFIAPAHDVLRGLEVKLPDYQQRLELSFSSFRIRLARPDSLGEATDDAVFNLKTRFLEEISVTTPGRRRAFRIYIPKELHAQLDSARKQETETLHLDRLDVIDFPTPMIVLNKFVRYVDRSLLKGTNSSSAGLGSWQRQKLVQYNEFFEALDYFIEQEGKKGRSIEYFQYRNSQDFILPA